MGIGTGRDGHAWKGGQSDGRAPGRRDAPLPSVAADVRAPAEDRVAAKNVFEEASAGGAAGVAASFSRRASFSSSFPSFSASPWGLLGRSGRAGRRAGGSIVWIARADRAVVRSGGRAVRRTHVRSGCRVVGRSCQAGDQAVGAVGQFPLIISILDSLFRFPPPLP